MDMDVDIRKKEKTNFFADFSPLPTIRPINIIYPRTGKELARHIPHHALHLEQQYRLCILWHHRPMPSRSRRYLHSSSSCLSYLPASLISHSSDTPQRDLTNHQNLSRMQWKTGSLVLHSSDGTSSTDGAYLTEHVEPLFV